VPLRTGRSGVPGTLLRYRRAVRAVLLLVTAVLAAGCTTAVPGTPSAAGPTPLPPRPREVRLDGVDPCSLLTAEQRAALGYRSTASSSRPYVELFGGEVPTCTMSSSSTDPTILGVGLVTTVGIERWQQGNLEAVSRPDHVAGFPAIVAVPSQSKTYCAVEVDVAAGQLLDIQFLDAGHQPPLRQEELCSRARRSAEAAIKTLLTR
jgi:hypothetical protein